MQRILFRTGVATALLIQQTANTQYVVTLKWVKDPAYEQAATGKFVKRRWPADLYQQRIIVGPVQAGGYPEGKGTVYNDSIPGDWEKKNGIHLHDAADATRYTVSKSGYTNIEEFLNSVVPLTTVTPATIKY